MALKIKLYYTSKPKNEESCLKESKIKVIENQNSCIGKSCSAIQSKEGKRVAAVPHFEGERQYNL